MEREIVSVAGSTPEKWRYHQRCHNRNPPKALPECILPSHAQPSYWIALGAPAEPARSSRFGLTRPAGAHLTDKALEIKLRCEKRIKHEGDNEKESDRFRNSSVVLGRYGGCAECGRRGRRRRSSRRGWRSRCRRSRRGYNRRSRPGNDGGSGAEHHWRGRPKHDGGGWTEHHRRSGSKHDHGNGHGGSNRSDHRQLNFAQWPEQRYDGSHGTIHRD